MLLERHCKPCRLQQGLRLLYHRWCCFERPGSMWEREHHPTRRQAALPDCQNQQVLMGHPTLPKVELCFGARSLYCNHLSSSPRDGLPLPQTCNKTPTKPLLNCKHKLKQLQWPKTHKDWTSEQWSKVIFRDQSK